MKSEMQSLQEEDLTYKQFPKWSYRRVQARIPARYVLYLMSFSGFLVSFMMRNDINLAIVVMVKMPARSNVTNDADDPLYCYDNVINDTTSSSTSSPYEEGEFDWSTTTQSTVLSSFYWCYIISQVLGGVLTQKFGMKLVFGISQLATAFSSLLIPVAADFHVIAVIFLRSVQGFASGLTWPAMYAAVGLWIPPKERSRFMSSFQGFSFGIGLTYPLVGWLIANFGWRSAFYTTGSIGTLWCIIWWLLAYDTPAVHPRITQHERNYIEHSLRMTGGTKGLPVPWRNIITSIKVWAIGITTFGRIWVSYTFIISGPMYMKTVLGFAIQKNGLLNGAPFLLSYFASVLFCYVADVLVVRKVMTLTNVRKLNTAIAQVIPGILVLLIGYLGCNLVVVLIAWFIAVICIPAAYAGAMASIVDIAPNFAGPILAFTQTIHMTASFLSPMVAGLLLNDNMTLEQWRKVFGVSAAVAVGTYGMFQVFGTSDVQDWNYEGGKKPQDLQELNPKISILSDSTKNGDIMK